MSKQTYIHASQDLVSERVCQAELILGVASKRCIGNGICSLYTKGSLNREKAYCHFAETKITTDANARLLFAFNKNTMRKSTKEKYFSRSSFIMEEDFLIPEFVQEELALNRYLIPQGHYLMYDFAGHYYVFFP